MPHHNNNQNVVLLYITAPTEKVANEIGAALVRKKLAACVNIHSPVKSVYRWRGTIKYEQEFVLIVKTIQDATDPARRLIEKLHPDETPCIIGLPISCGHSSDKFLNWVKASVAV